MNKLKQFFYSKKGDVNWYLIGMILALVVLAILIVVFRSQIMTAIKNITLLTPKNETLINISQCLTDPTLPGCK